MPVPALVGVSIWAVAIVPIVVKILVSLGIGFVSYKGITSLTDNALELIRSNIAALPADMAQVVGITKIDVYFSMVFSAYAIRLTLKGVDQSGILRKLAFGALPS